MQPALLDTDILSEVLKQKDATVVQRASTYLQQEQFTISAMTWYEIIRGLKFKRATRQLKNFERFCDHCIVYPITDDVLQQAADLWVLGERGGHPHRDADLIIAATALKHDRTLVTGNREHFGWIANLTVENWREP
jgi:tRNA(fMet)-specific endonuclease VapC